MARKQRLNVQFILIVGIPFVLLVGGIAARYVLPRYFPQLKWFFRGTPTEHATKAKAFYDAGDFENARDEYGRAIQLTGAGDAPLYSALADCYSHLIVDDNENVQKMRACWGSALSIDPNYLPVLNNLVDHYAELCELSGGKEAAALWESVQTTAAKIVALEPANQKAQMLQNRATIERWRLGVDTDSARIDEAISSLTSISQQTPFVPEALYYALLARAQQGLDRIKASDRPAATTIFATVIRTLDENLAAHDDNARLHLYATRLLRDVGRLERNPDQPPKYLDRVRAETIKAAGLIKPEDSEYINTQLELTTVLQVQDDMAGATKLCRELLAKYPDDLLVRLQLAQLLARDNATRAESVTILEKIPPADKKRTFGVEAIRYQRFQVIANLALIDAKLESLGDVKDAPSRESIIKQAEESYAKLISNPGWAEHPLALLERGRLELLRGQALQAVQTLDRSLHLLDADSPQRFQVMGVLANAYLLTQQTGQARTLLNELVDRTNNMRARLILARLNVNERNMTEARRHLDVLAKQDPNSIEIMSLQIQSMDKVKEADKIDALYTKLPEKTPEDMAIKAQLAMIIERRPEAVRLLEALRAARPDDMGVLGALAKQYLDSGDSVKANALVDAEVAKAPDRVDLRLLQAEIASSDTREIRKDLIDKIADPLAKELALYRLSLQENNAQEALAHLQNAAAINPENTRVLDQEFQQALRSRQFDLAAKFADSLAKQNADMAGGYIYRAKLAMARGAMAEAADLAQQLTKNMPQIAGSWDLLGDVQRAQKKYSEAIQSYELALGKQTKDLNAVMALISCNYDLHQPANAKVYIDKGRQLWPNYAVLKELELTHELNYGDPEKAIAPRKEMLQQAITAKSANEDRAWMSMGDTYLAVARSKNTPQDAKPFVEQAADTYKKASEKWPDQIKFVQLYADTQLQLRNVAEGERAIRALVALPLWQGKPEPTVLLSDFLGRAGKAQDQEKVLRDYLTSAPTTVPIQIKLSSLLARQGKFDDAMKLLEVNADDPMIRRQRIEMQISNNHLADAEKEINGVLAATPNPTPVLLNRQAFLYMKSGRATQALQVLDKVLTQNPNDAEAMFYRASVYVASKTKLDQAILDLQLLRDVPGLELNSRTMLSDAYHYTGDDDAAARELEEALKQFPLEKPTRLRLLDYYANARPPRWTQAERVLREGRGQPQLANDVELMHAEAIMWLTRKELKKAGDLITAAMRIAPDDMKLVRTWCDYMLQDKQSRQLLASTDPMVKSKKAPWWVYHFRGKARKALDDRQAALDEYATAFEMASGDRDDAAVSQIVDTIVADYGVGAAKMRVLPAAEKGDNRSQMLMSSLLEKEQDYKGAIEWALKVVNDAKADDFTHAGAQLRAANLYLRLSPPDAAKAVAIYRELLAKNPNDLVALNNLACTIILPNSGFAASEALPYSDQAFKIVQQSGEVNSYIYDTQGYVLVLNGRLNEGIAILRQSIDKEPIPEACYHLGEAFLALPRPLYSDAEENLKQALALLDAQDKDQKPLDSELKSKIEKALERAKPPEPPKPS